MAPRRFSRHTFTTGSTDSEGRTSLTDRVPYRFQKLSDNRHHVVSEGDTLWSLAFRYFRPLPRPAGLWWVIADFQPTPIIDPTIKLSPGGIIVIPSVRTVVEDIFDESRRSE